ncbi:hypothetical protein OG21DRAFT_1485403 [Imleria badia]|nr:hypothetical protein OG21DRAFT_1485403 [Imleria badia]
MQLTRETAEDDRGTRATSLAAGDRPRTILSLKERLSQPAPTSSLRLQDHQSVPTVVLVWISCLPSLEERLSSGPVPLCAPPPNDDLRDHDRIPDFRTNRDFSRERPGGPISITSSYRPDLDRGFGDRDDRDVADINPPPAHYGDTFSRGLPPRRYSRPPPVLDRDHEQERAHRHRSVVKARTIPVEKEDILPIENAARMNNGGRIGTHLATTTSADRHHHHLQHGDLTKDRPSWTETGTGTFANETGIETGI